MNWEYKDLIDVCEINLGKTPSRSNKRLWDINKIGNNKWASIADLTKVKGGYLSDTKEYISDEGAKLFNYVKPNTILMSFKLSIGKLAITKEKIYTNEAIVALPIKNNKELNQDFLYYYLEFYDWEKESENDVKVKGKTLNKDKLKKIKIPLPPFPIQQKIVEKLDTIFVEIDKATAAIEANVKNAEALFKNYLKKTYKGDKNWKIVTLRDVSKVIAGQSPKGINYNKEGKGLPFYQGKKDFGDRYINIPSVWTTEITKEAIKEDILISVRAPVGPVNIANEHICIGRGLAAIRTTDKINKEYLFNYFLKIEKELVSNVGAVFNSINKTQIENLKIPLPNLTIQQDIVSKINKISSEVNKLNNLHKNKLSDLVFFKQSIIKQAFNGEFVKTA
jgi:type I restriction enzyme S subunit